MKVSQIKKFVSDINSIERSNAQHVLSEIYTEDIVFTDPIKTINGLENLTKYFEGLYTSLTSCNFTLKSHTPNSHEHSIEWLMRFQHKKIASNKMIEIDGASFIEFKDNKVCSHRDYYDLGALVYEHIPVLGSIIKKVRNAI